MTTKGLFYRTLNEAGSVFEHLKPDDFNKPTPDAEWDVKTLANHIVYELSWVPDILAGKTITEVADKYDGDLIDDNPADAWQDAADKAREAVEEADLSKTVHLSYGDMTAEYYVREIAADLLIHAWDLAAALGIEHMMNKEAAEEVYKDAHAKAEDMAGSGLFGKPLDVPQDADIQTRLLAHYGRDANWQPS